MLKLPSQPQLIYYTDMIYRQQTPKNEDISVKFHQSITRYEGKKLTIVKEKQLQQN